MKRTKKALIVWGGWEGHEPEKCAKWAAELLRQAGYHVRASKSLNVFGDAAGMKRLDLVVPVWTMGELTAEQFTGLRDAVAAGTGIAGWHGGMCDAFRTHTDYQFMTGGQFVAHPGNIRRYRVKITAKRDPIMTGLRDFEVETEQYYMHTDPSNLVLATTTFDQAVHPWIAGTVMPVVWKRQFGAGRVFYCALGHSVNDLKAEPVQTIIRRGLLWATR